MAVTDVDNQTNLSYYLFNGHGDVVHTVSETGEIENTYDYDFFGSPILSIESYANAIRYAGEFYDEESGLYYLRARYYDSYIGRFISEDSYWGEDNNPLSLNRYTYTHNDPINYIDPSGHAAAPTSNERRIALAAGILAALTGKTSKSEVETIVTKVTKIVETNTSSSSSSSNSSSSSSSSSSPSSYANSDSRNSLPPEWLDWDRDGVVDTRQDNSSFDKNGNGIADWLEEGTDQNWVYNGNTGWDDVATLKPNQVYGPSAEDVRSMYNMVAQGQLESYTSWGIPNSEFMNNAAQLSYLIMGNTKEKSRSEVQIASYGDSTDSMELQVRFLKGVINGAVGSAKDFWGLIKDYKQTIEAGKEVAIMYYNFERTGDWSYLLPIKVAIDNEIDEEIEQWKNGNRYDRSEQIGEYVGGALLEIIGAKGIGVVLKNIKLLKTITGGKATVPDIMDALDLAGTTSLKKEVLQSAGLKNFEVSKLNDLLKKTSDPDLKYTVIHEAGFDNFRPDFVENFDNYELEIYELKRDLVLYRRGYPTEDQSGNNLGKWWGIKERTIEESRNELALLTEWGNPLTGEFMISVPAGTRLIAGIAAKKQTLSPTGNVIEERIGGGYQVWLNEASKEWLIEE